jgi:hypothetical protein
MMLTARLHQGARESAHGVPRGPRQEGLLYPANSAPGQAATRTRQNACKHKPIESGASGQAVNITGSHTATERQAAANGKAMEMPTMLLEPAPPWATDDPVHYSCRQEIPASA